MLVLYGNYTLEITALWLSGEQNSRRLKLPGLFSLLLVSGYGLQMKLGNVSLVYNFSQFWSLLDQLCRSPEHHSFVRETSCKSG